MKYLSSLDKLQKVKYLLYLTNVSTVFPFIDIVFFPDILPSTFHGKKYFTEKTAVYIYMFIFVYLFLQESIIL